ncbi:polysaccharide deacetylase family protein (plasmid) [Escherichia albertii]|uniref:polysaccharide deacetylase family protein n=1 Tax=Escherichia albertii TaxID=208962 RepID=UPI000F5E295D|nr:polysaccharide deacetylase family protein [Escherichia albertii]MCZ8642012.1 polysaccharide deacetylase family protein [Escherichia albertii]MCZ9212356.1 polysaccharide deacetylase family protein [Escherichia albertii]QSZ87305.1 polysaccharide deacetylase family protein [Escherichia albertii]QSZ96114.1 polysaccharide deacetylase family protein [Escherichia albertii]QTA00478.1 polysaccharide deacetylase family protein [Escherichia albertii]
MSNLTVVMYHYVRPIGRSRYPSIKGLELNDFKEQVAYIKKNYNPVAIEDVYASFYEQHDLPPNAALLTFDDAYLDHFKYVYPILKKNRIQGCFYAPAKTIEEKEILDVNKIHFILAACTDISKLLSDTKSLFELFREGYDVKEFHEYFEELAVENRFDTKEVIFIKRFLQVALPEKLRSKICHSLFNTYVNVSEDVFCEELYMTKDQLSHMVADGMHVGSHGYNHYWWNKLDKITLTEEIDRSLGFLKSIDAYSDNWTACYPYGSSSLDVTNLLREKGCKLAFTTVVDVASTASDNPLLIPRLDTNDLPKLESATINNWYR